MKKRDARTLAEKIHDRYMLAAVAGEGFDEAFTFTRRVLRRATSDASNAGFAQGKAEKQGRLACFTANIVVLDYVVHEQSIGAAAFFAGFTLKGYSFARMERSGNKMKVWYMREE